MASNSHCNANLAKSKRRSNSSPQLHCEATDFSSITGVDSTCSANSASADVPRATANHAVTASWSETLSAATDMNAKEDPVTMVTKTPKFPVANVTQASVHWLEPKQRAVMPELHDQLLVVKPKAKSALAAGCDKVHVQDAGIGAASCPEPDLLCCNETIHYLQGSDSDSEACQPSVQRRKSHASFQKRRRDGSQKFKRLSRVANQLLSKLKLQETKSRTAGKTRREENGSDESESESDQPVVRRRSRSLTNRVLKRLGPKDKDASPERCSAKASQTESPVMSGRGKHKSKRSSKAGKNSGSSRGRKTARQTPLVNFAKFDPEKYPIECTEEIERAAREREIEEGIVLEDQVPLGSPTMGQCAATGPAQDLQLCGAPALENAIPIESGGIVASTSADEDVDAPTHTTENIYDLYGSLTPSGTFIPRTVHTQIDYMHCLVPDQWNIMKSSFYWGKIDRYEADSLLENKEEGTFLLRDSAQEEFLFSVSFCRYGRTLHARIEQWNHKFSFDAHDPGVYSSDTICSLLEHYKDPNYCMFFEPMLTNPLHRVNPPSLLELSRAQICSNVSYDSICYLKLPNSLKEFLREYHYKQRVRIRRVEVDMPQIPDVKQTVVSNTCISR